MDGHQRADRFDASPSPKPAQLVDKSRGEKLVVNMNITFPRVPCYLLSVDIMDISGEHQNGGRVTARRGV